MPWFEQYSDVMGGTGTYASLHSSGIVYGNIGSAVDTDWYRMDLQAGVKYTVYLNSLNAGFAANLVLRDVGGNVLYTAPVTSGGSNGIFLTPAVGSTYYWDVEGTGTTGNYSLTAVTAAYDDYSAGPNTTSILSLGQTKTGSIETWADADWHRANLTAGHTYYFTDIGGSLADPFLQIFSRDDGPNLVYSGSGTVLYTPSISGTYFVDVSSNSYRGTGSYQLVANEVPAITVTNQYVYRGLSGTKDMVFTLNLSSPVPYNVSVSVNTHGETAKAGTDYLPLDQTVTFLAGATTATVNVSIIGTNDFLPALAFELNLSNPVGATIKPNYYDPTGTPQSFQQPNAWGVIWDTNTGPYGNLPADGYFPYEWYLFTTRSVLAWSHATGKGVKIAVFDQGIDGTNPDLTVNDSVSLGLNANSLYAGGVPILSTDNHGTLVAGVIGAARDGQGLVGVAYDAKLIPIYTPSSLNLQYLTDIKNAFTYAKGFDVLNNSWGYGNQFYSNTNYAFYDDANNPSFAPAFRALQDLVTTGRNALGTIVVQSAGNTFGFGDDTNLHNFQNSRYIITVGATDYFGNDSYFSTTGASILVSAPGGAGKGNFNSILTTDRSGSAGENSSNLAFADGTSFSAPIVSGIVALMLEVNPHLGYRDVQEILAYTAHHPETGSWDNNGALNWNGAGLRYNSITQSSGFGQVDALAAVRLAETWNSTPKTVANTVDVTASQSAQMVIPDNGGITNSAISKIHISNNLTVERVDVTVNIIHPFIGDLGVVLISPAGTVSILMNRPAKGNLSAIGSGQHDVHFTFDTVLNWGESAVGDWTLLVADLQGGDIGVLNNWSIDLIGQAANNNHTFIYTNEFPSLVNKDPSRGVLNDPTGGIDSINASALGSDNKIDLSGVSSSSLNGGVLSIAQGTTIQNAYGGDGNDTLVANSKGSVLYGMAGNDVLIGGSGKDTLMGGKGNDHIDGGAGIDTAIFDSIRANYSIVNNSNLFTVKDNVGLNGTDTLVNVERVNFTDVTVGFDIAGNAGQAYRIYQAAFGRKPDLAGLGYWIGDMDKGTSLTTVAAGFFQSPEFKALYGVNPSIDTLITTFYKNVLHRAPDQAGFDYWRAELTTGHISSAGALASFSESQENQLQIIGSIQNGIDYLPYHG